MEEPDRSENQPFAANRTLQRRRGPDCRPTGSDNMANFNIPMRVFLNGGKN
jgi:hypothetical protein